MTRGFIARKTPAPVATPFPPLNFRKTGKRCPENAARPTRAIIKVGSPKLYGNECGDKTLQNVTNERYNAQHLSC